MENLLYTVFTVSTVDNNLMFHIFDSYEKAKNMIDSNTESNIKIAGKSAIIYEKFGTEEDRLSVYKPAPVRNLFPFDTIKYGTTVREAYILGNSKEKFYYTYRFIIESKLNEK